MNAATPELAGYFIIAHRASFVLLEPESGERSGWLEVGDIFTGYRIVEFRREESVVFLERDGERIPIPLRNAIIREQQIAFSGEIVIGSGEALNVAEGSLRFGETTSFPVSDGVVLHLKAAKRPDGNILYAARFEITQPDGTTEVRGAPSVITRPGEPFSAIMGDLSFTLQPSTAPVR